MRTLIRVAKTSLAIILLAFGLAVAAAKAQAQNSFEIKPRFECGIYKIQGRMVLNQQNMVILQARPRTPVFYEMILDGLPLEEIITRNDTVAILEVEIRQRETETQPLRARFRKFVSDADFQPNWNSYNFVRASDCL